MDEEGKFSPPYNIAWATFLTSVERIAQDPPGRIDRSYLGSVSGTIQTYLIAALKSFSLIDDEGRPTRVKDMADPEARKAVIRSLLEEFYPGMVALGTSSTTVGQLNEEWSKAFPNLTGESKVKGIRFFISAMTYADLPRSSLWGGVKAPRGASTSKPKTRKVKTVDQNRDQGGSTGGGTSGETVVVDLGDAGRVTVTVNVQWLQLDDDTFAALRKSITDLKALAKAASSKAGPKSSASAETETKDDAPEGSEE